RGGTHWTAPAACAVAQEVVLEVGDARLLCLPGPPRRARGADMDLADLLNVWDASRFADLIPEVRPMLDRPTAARPTLYFGTSFGTRPIQVLTDAGAIRDVTRVNYFHAGQRSDRSRLARARLVVLEQSQAPFITANLTELAEELELRLDLEP